MFAEKEPVGQADNLQPTTNWYHRFQGILSRENVKQNLHIVCVCVFMNIVQLLYCSAFSYTCVQSVRMTIAPNNIEEN